MNPKSPADDQFEDDDEEYVLLGDAKELTRNSHATATESGNGHG
jgi:hypothetical protein